MAEWQFSNCLSQNYHSSDQKKIGWVVEWQFSREIAIQPFDGLFPNANGIWGILNSSTAKGASQVTSHCSENLLLSEWLIHYFPEGTRPRWGGVTYLSFGIIFAKTEWKWKKIDWEMTLCIACLINTSVTRTKKDIWLVKVNLLLTKVFHSWYVFTSGGSRNSSWGRTRNVKSSRSPSTVIFFIARRKRRRRRDNR